jgi:glycosyltransferase involved in cell wall biosynthesis
MFLDALAMARIIQAAPHVGFISNYVAGIWRKWFSDNGFAYPEADRVSTIYHGLDLAQFRPLPRARSEIFVVGVFGALRTDVRIRAIFEVSRRLGFHHRFVIRGSMTPDCRRLLADLRARHPECDVDVYGWTRPSVLPACYSAIDCLLHVVDFEGFGIVMSEAMACGVPVVAPALGGALEVAAGGGVLVQSKQFVYDDAFYEALSAGVEQVHANALDMGAKARTTAVERFDIDAIAQRIAVTAEALR